MSKKQSKNGRQSDKQAAKKTGYGDKKLAGPNQPAE